MARVIATYRRVQGDIEEAERIARLLQEEVNREFEELKANIPELTKRLNVVGKWNEVVAELKTPAPPASPRSSRAALADPPPDAAPLPTTTTDPGGADKATNKRR